MKAILLNMSDGRNILIYTTTLTVEEARNFVNKVLSALVCDAYEVASDDLQYINFDERTYIEASQEVAAARRYGLFSFAQAVKKLLTVLTTDERRIFWEIIRADRYATADAGFKHEGEREYPATAEALRAFFCSTLPYYFKGRISWLNKYGRLLSKIDSIEEKIGYHFFI